jgi:periplasmic divalent cation tolerance protein
MAQPGLIFVTAETETEAQKLADMLIRSRLAACVSVMPIQSIYRWQGKVHHDAEYQLLIKADLVNFDQLASKIRALHSYEVPEIIAIPIVKGDQDYLAWMQAQVTAEDEEERG